MNYIYSAAIILFLSGFATGNHFTETVSDGDWKDSISWSNGVPRNSSSVIINHKIDISNSLINFNGTLIINDTVVLYNNFDFNGTLHLNYTGAILNEISYSK